MKVDARSIWVAGAFGTVIALAANLAVYLVGAVAGVSFVSTAGSTAGQTINAVPITVMTVLWMLIGIGFAVLLNRWGRLRTAQIVGAVFAVLSIGLLLPAGFDAGSAMLLAVMHLVTGAVFVLALERARRRGEVVAQTEQASGHAAR